MPDFRVSRFATRIPCTGIPLWNNEASRIRCDSTDNAAERRRIGHGIHTPTNKLLERPRLKDIWGIRRCTSSR